MEPTSPRPASTHCSRFCAFCATSSQHWLKHWSTPTISLPLPFDDARTGWRLCVPRWRPKQHAEEPRSPAGTGRAKATSWRETLETLTGSAGLIDAAHSGDFEPWIEDAIEKYRQDTSSDTRNYAPKEYWPSTGAFPEGMRCFMFPLQPKLTATRDFQTNGGR
jgi:hypothetical protein